MMGLRFVAANDNDNHDYDNNDDDNYEDDNDDINVVLMWETLRRCMTHDGVEVCCSQ